MGFALVTTFTNCDAGFDDLSDNEDLSQLCGEDCFQTEAQLLIRLNHDVSFPIASNTREFNVGGDCNAGGHPLNQVTWRLYNDNQTQPISDIFTQPLANGAAIPLGRCENGRFQLFVRLPQTGLTEDHRLEVEIEGIDEQGRFYQSPTGESKKSILLTLGI